MIDALRTSSILITGGTGLIGSSIVNFLLNLKMGIKIILPVRSMEKVRRVYGDIDNQPIIVQECNLVEWLDSTKEHFDYVIHCASPTDGKYMVEHPVETYELAYDSTKALLKYCNRQSVKSMVFVSSLEYYGQNGDDRIIDEDFVGYVDPLSVRSSYPLGKRAAEYLCFAYSSEYGAPVKIARLTQTFGPEVSPSDNRVFMQFARSVVEGSDIVLHTTGESAKPYCYTSDCANAILHILLKGKNGEAYNVANDETYISIKDMALFLQKNFNPNVEVKFEVQEQNAYAPPTKLRLSASKLKALGWQPKYDLKEMYKQLINSLKNGK